MKKLILILIVIAAVVSGCEKRVQIFKKILGTYNLIEYNVDGADYLYFYKDSLGLDFKFYYNDLHNEYDCIINGVRNDGREIGLYWNWGLSEDNRFIIIPYSFGPIGTGPFGKNKTPTWEIISLTNKKLKMKTTYNSKEYIIELEKK